MNIEAPRSDTPAPALVLIADSRLRAEVCRVAAAAERELAEGALPVGRHAWTGAPLVILDTALAEQCADAAYLRRVGVVVVTEGEPQLRDWQVAAAVGAERVIALPGSAESLIEMFAAYGERGTGDGVVVAVAGTGAGAGASTLAAAIALRAAAEQFRAGVVLVDCAPHGGGLDLLLGLENAPGLRWPDLVIEDGRVSAAALHDALPKTGDGLAVLSCGRGGSGRLARELGAPAVRAVIEAGRAAGDLVVCDISSERGAQADEALDAADLVALVVPARLRSLAAAETVSAHIARRNPNQGLIVRGPAPGGLRGAEVAEVLGLPLLAAVRAQPGLAHRVERGGLTVRRRSPLREAADAILDVLSAPAGQRR